MVQECVFITDYIVALSTCPEKEANNIATALVESRKCACVNIIREITSIYHWKGKIDSETESILLMKSVAGKVQELFEELCNLHSYEVPEFIILPFNWGPKDYFDWITESTARSIYAIPARRAAYSRDSLKYFPITEASAGPTM